MAAATPGRSRGTEFLTGVKPFQLLQRPLFDGLNLRSREAELLSDLIERARLAPVKAEAKTKDFALVLLE